ncbi:MAG: TolC family protein [Polyangiaceae bacterium]
MKRRWLAFSVVVLALTTASASSRADEPGSPAASGTAVLTQEEALARFRTGSYELLARKYEVSAARADVLGAGLLANPQVGVTGAFLLHGVPSGGNKELYLTVTQNAPFAGQLGLRRDAAKGFATAAERELAAEAWLLANEVRLAYVDLQVADARLEAIERAAADLGRVERVIGERVGAGANPPYDKARVTMERSALLERRTEAEAAVLAARTALAEAIGRGVSPASLRVEKISGEPATVPDDGRPLVEEGKKRRAELAAAEARVTASLLRVAAARRGVVPAPDVTLGYSHYFDIPNGAGSASGGAFVAGLSFPIPVFDRAQGAVGRGNAEAEAERARARRVELTIEREIELAHATVLVRKKAFVAYRDTISSDVERLRQMAEVSYREGRATILELLDAYGTYANARLRAIDLDGAARRAVILLERAVGPRDPGARSP